MDDYFLQTGKKRILRTIEQELGIQTLKTMLEESVRNRALIEVDFLLARLRFLKTITAQAQQTTGALVEEAIKGGDPRRNIG